MGITRCTQLAKKAVFWTGINSDINRLCIRNQGDKKLSMVVALETLEGPWQKVAVDYMEFKNSLYLSTSIITLVLSKVLALLLSLHLNL